MEDWYINSLDCESGPLYEGPFASYEEAELWACTHDMTNYLIVIDTEPIEDLDEWDWYWDDDDDCEYEDDLDIDFEDFSSSAA